MTDPGTLPEGIERIVAEMRFSAQDRTMGGTMKAALTAWADRIEEAGAAQERARHAEVEKHARAVVNAFTDDEADIQYPAFRDIVERLETALAARTPPPPEAQE